VSRGDREALLVPPGDAASLRGALRVLLDGPERRAELVAAGRTRAEEFSMVGLAERFVGIYARALAASPVPGSAAGRAV
jgi:glycosyltransferase involved in cell wall biosynthesis